MRAVIGLSGPMGMPRIARMRKGLALHLFASLAVVTTGEAAVIGKSHLSVSGLTFNFEQDFAKTDHTGFLFSHVGLNFFTYEGSFLDQGVSLFMVENGDEFTDENILGGSFPEFTLGQTEGLPSVTVLGFRTPSFPSFELPPAFGWATVQTFTSGTMAIIDHAVAYESGGIIVGTQTAIPEPLAAGMLALATIILFSRKRAAAAK